MKLHKSIVKNKMGENRVCLGMLNCGC